MAARAPAGGSGQSSSSGSEATLQARGPPAGLVPPHLAPTDPGTSGPAWGSCRCSSSPRGTACRSPGRRPPGTPAAGRHSAPPGHTRPLRHGRACRPAAPDPAEWSSRRAQRDHRQTHRCRFVPSVPGTPSHPLTWGHTGWRQEEYLGAPCSPCIRDSRRHGHTRRPGPGGRWWHCSSGSDSPGEQAEG